ncbi:class I SAM-dependent methyltransferase [Amycolatopsis sp.]|uniref:class I SAM-dependent methyltransferase n=1 Tax=Amycolatopsis sp. TaxID=37632 RepID=UPI0026049462|nr:class I SAM-dependent methyltransferase [Amycolatopsis sp.]
MIRLLAGAESSGATLLEAIDALGPARIAALLTSEVAFRARLSDLSLRLVAPLGIVLEFLHGGRSFATIVEIGPDGVRLCEELEGDRPETVLTQDLEEAVRTVYGPRDLVSVASQVVRWPEVAVMASGGMAGQGLPSAYYPFVQRVLRSLSRREPADLAELAAECGTDKWSALHRYPEHYDRHFGSLRERRLTVLEIGVGGFGDPGAGAESLRMWKHYFPRAILYGLDIEDKREFDELRIVTVRGDQSDPVSLAAFAEDVGPFDIVIDDGSHVSADVITSFRTLFSHVRPNGLYVIEDLQTSYWKPMFGGDDSDLTDPQYTMGFLKTLLDGLHHEEFLRAEAWEPQPTDGQIRGVHFYHNLCFIEKGPNVEGGLFAETLRLWGTRGKSSSG